MWRMSSGGTDYVDIFIVAILWGCTNPFLRKGTVEEDEKLRIEQELMKQNQQHPNHNNLCTNNDGDCKEDAPFSPKMESSYSYQSTLMNDSTHRPTFVDYKLYDDSKQVAIASPDNKNTNAAYSSTQLQQSQETKTQPPVPFIKGAFLQFLNKICNCSNENLRYLSKFHPKSILDAFLTSIVYELKKFTKPKIAIPFMFNQCSAIFYFRLIATSDLTNVAYCQAMSMAIEGIVSYLLGERMNDPMRGFGGAAVVTLGVGICLLSKNIEDDGNNVDDNGYYRDRFLTSWFSDEQENEHGLFEISPFVCWFALFGIINGIINLN